jgi:hypothetical protein
VAVLTDRDNLEITRFVERSLNLLSSRFHDQLRSQPRRRRSRLPLSAPPLIRGMWA